MKTILTLLASLVIVGGAYFFSFGLPDVFFSETRDQPTEAQVPAGPGGPGGPRGGGATTVVLKPLKLRPYEDTFRAIGSSEAVESAVVTSDVSGRIVALNLPPNAKVSQGDILVQLDARAAAYSLETAQIELEQASDTVSRFERLKQSQNSAVSDVAISEAKLAQRLAEANVGQAQLALEDRTVRAPISGKLGLSDVSVEDFISANTPIVTIDNPSALLVEFELPERSIGFLSLGREVILETPSLTGRFLKGEITSFDSRIDAVTRSVTVKATVENLDRGLWPGMTFTARLTNLSDPLAVVPSTAITWSRDGASVWYEESGKAMPAPVTILFRRNETVWLDVDLPVGTPIVTEGAHKLRSGAEIKDANPPRKNTDQEPK
ncbi:efflux RND transporter periplasmic adaptor subunit [Shimia sp. Alg240-R146]|uniref:efflux RND transporter periplasmic adaptor subunit n=1 Tax=Shimia sp. Alg240-R146 TaxID=2993449 RepID=UPI0022E5CCA4|nr:efflux RND transporter periplasmic adaptor subunit [Shimia sp. Alg240-R146]